MTPLTVGSLCTGYGGLEAGLAAADWPTRTVWHADKDPDASRLLAHHHPDVPNHGDITTIDWANVDPVDVLTGGFPCQDVSAAGLRAGIRPGTRSGLWLHIAHGIDVLRPSIVVIENVGGILNAPADRGMGPTDPYVEAAGTHALRALGCVLGDLADIGYDAVWYGLPAASIGAPHRRFRVFIVAYPAGQPPQLGTAVRPATAGAGRGELNLLPTPGARLGDGRGAPDAGLAARRMGEQGRRNLDDAVALLPTPTVGDSHNSRNATANRAAPLPTTVTTGWTLADVAYADRWGQYAPAIARWEAILGRPAPDPTEPGTRGGQRLSPRFVEWMQGLPDGHVTAVPGLTRNAMLRLLGNGVVPQQAAAAITHIADTIRRAA